jgi:hypothetical protein
MKLTLSTKPFQTTANHALADKSFFSLSKDQLVLTGEEREKKMHFDFNLNLPRNVHQTCWEKKTC